MSDRSLARLLRMAGVTGGTLAVAGSVVLIGIGHAGSWWSGFFAFLALFSVFFAIFVWLVIAQQPRNMVVWTMAAAAFFGGLFVVGAAGAALLVDDPNLAFEFVAPADLPASAAWILMVSAPAASLGLFPLLTFGLLLFPDGRLPSPRWRWVAVLAAVGIAVTTAAEAWALRPGSTVPIEVVEDEGLLFNAGLLAVMLVFILSLAALVGRFRRSSGATRQQFKWIVWGASIFVPALIAMMMLGNSRYEDAGLSVLMVATAVFLGSYGIAVGRYRLYDIDVVISRTVTYVSLTVVIGLLYTAGILGFIFVFGDSGQRGGDLGVALPIGATGLVAIAFEPIRSRLQRRANRLVYGKRAAPAEVLSELTSRLSDSSASGGLVGLAQLLRDGAGAESAVVWLRVGDRLRVEAASPPDAMPNTSDIGTEEDLPGSELELSVPVRHGGELLGALGVTKPRAHPVTPADETLLGDVAAGAGLLLRNLRLNAELTERAAQLQASRRRLIAAHDASRHRLERDLHDGAQQQVVALKVKLGLAKTIAEREGALELAARVGSLADGTQQAVDAMRTVARGIYPPLLEAEGLGAALTAAQRTSGLPVRIESGTLPRYSKQVEETIYFCVLAAIHQAQMAGATTAHIELQGDKTSLSVIIASDTADIGSTQTAVTDRIDAYGGTVTSATSAEGTTLTLRLPVERQIMEPA